MNVSIRKALTYKDVHNLILEMLILAEIHLHKAPLLDMSCVRCQFLILYSPQIKLFDVNHCQSTYIYMFIFSAQFMFPQFEWNHTQSKQEIERGRVLKPHCPTCSYLLPLYRKQCLIGDHWVPHDPLFLMLIESWVDEITTCPVTFQGGLIPHIN